MAFHSFEEGGVLHEVCSMFSNIPIEIEIVCKRIGNDLGKRSLSCLAWPHKEYHTFINSKIPPDFDIWGSPFHADYYSQ